MENIAKKTHPLILIAAGSITVASLAAAAHFTGLIPTRAPEAPPPVIATAPAPAVAPVAPAVAPQAAVPAAEAPKPAARPRTPRHETRSSGEPDRQVRNEDWRQDGTRRVANNDSGIDVIPSRPQPVTSQPPAQAQTPMPPVCRECGTVEGVREVEARGEGTGLGAIAGGVLGGLLGHQVGRGHGKDLATVAGAVGGAVAGHQVEKNVRSEKQYQVTVRFDDGTVRTYSQASATGWRNGDRVRLENGNIRAI